MSVYLNVRVLSFAVTYSQLDQQFLHLNIIHYIFVLLQRMLCTFQYFLIFQFIDYRMIVIIRTIMKDYRNFSWYFISEIAHIISCSSKYSCVMTVMSNFCMPSNFIFIEFFFAGMTTFCFFYLLSCLFVNSIISFCSQLIGLVT